MSDATDAGDLAGVVAEIEDDVRQRRAAGEIPLDLERELDEVLARFALDDTAGAGFDRQLGRVERAAVLDLVPSFASARPGSAAAKRLVHKAVGFELRHVAGQVGELGAGMVEALRSLDRRLSALEGGALLDVLPPSPAPDLGPWEGLIAERMAGVSGRVAHGGASDTALCDELEEAGVDAYVVDGPVERHLAGLAPSSLGGVVLSGWVDEAPAAARWRVVQIVHDVLEPGGTVVVVATDVAGWERSLSPVAADLAPGRPFRPETWAHLLGRAGFEAVEVHGGTATHAVTASQPR